MLKVFIVEDESVIREGLRDRIPWEQYGFRFVGEAADGERALPLIRKLRPDVLITDIKMPFMDGLSLSKIVRAEMPDIKIIIISGYDDFEYARGAIEAGVDQYLLKPITRQSLRTVLAEMKKKIEQEQEQKDYQLQYQNEMQEYEQFSRRHFFEKILEGKLSVKEIYDEAAKHSIEIAASCYNILLFGMRDKSELPTKEQSEAFSRKQEQILLSILRRPQYILFRWNVSCYGVLIKAEPDHIQELTEKCVEIISGYCSEDAQLEWYVAVSEPVERLSQLPQCYQKANHYYASRFMNQNLHILSGDTLKTGGASEDEKDLTGVDSARMNPEIIREFLERGNSSEIQEFVESYLESIKDTLKSKMFRNYVVLNIRFTTIAYVEALGVTQKQFLENLSDPERDMHMEAEDVNRYFVDMLQSAIRIREQESDYQSGKILRKALEYIDENFDKESFSLNSAAEEIGISANYLSGIFSHSMEKTFVEYVTGKKMEKAKKLLKTTDKTSSEIALEIGYRDAHYFSFVFKKTQGLSPREYRNSKKA